MKAQNYLKTRLFLLTACAAFATSAVAATPKVQVWDFGAEQLDATLYENMLTEDVINAWYDPSITPGTSGVSIANINDPDHNLIFNGNVTEPKHRLRTSNTNLTRFDNKTRKTESGALMTGYLYSNSSSTNKVYLSQNYTKGDRIEMWVSSNGSAATYTFEAPSGATQTAEYTKAYEAELVTFYVTEDGAHKLYVLNEKLAVCRISRYVAQNVVVSGTVTAPAGIPAGYQLLFTAVQSGAQYSTTVTDGSYSLPVASGYDYTVSLLDANGYIVSSGLEISTTYGQETATHNVEIVSVDLVTMSGAIIGLPATGHGLDVLTFKFTLPEGKIYIPEMTIDRKEGTYSFSLEPGVTYGIEALNVNDYALDITTVGIDLNTDIDLTFTAKPTYAITISPTGATLADLAEATFTFANLNEEGYSYTFTGTDGIVLRDGVYSVTVENSGVFTQLLTSNLKVDGAPATKVIDFTSDVTSWDFKNMSNYDASNNVKIPCSGLTYVLNSGGKFQYHGPQYGSQASNAVISVPVAGPGTIRVAVGYTWDITFGGTNYQQTTDIGTRTLTLDYTGAAGYAEITVGNACTSYIASIEFAASQPYAATVTVGADKDYPTINDALAAIRKMERPNNEVVTIMIDPGNYEEMLLIDLNNIRMVNASATPSIAIKDAGVNIDDNAVRITSYYGHGYNYASMSTDFRWDARTLQVNKENGYASVVNGGGSGTTYWNATVVVSGKDFYAENIIFENSYNQYISAKEAADVVYPADGNKGVRPTEVGSTAVQARSFRERAAAFATTNTADRTFLNNCRVIGRQDSFYGAEGRVACYKGALMGACDYLFGEMNLTCYQTDLVLNTADDSQDVAYITAAKTNDGQRGMFFLECNVIGAESGVETASAQGAKPAYWGRPWAANTGEAIFAACNVGTSTYSGANGQSLILPAGWNSGLSGESARCGEYLCNTPTTGRVAWAMVLAEPTTADGLQLTLHNWTKGTDDWNPFKEYGVDTDALPGTQYATGLPQDFFTESGLQIVPGMQHIALRGVDETMRVELLSVDGRLLDARTISADTEIALDGKGVYIVRATGLSGRIVAQKVCL